MLKLPFLGWVILLFFHSYIFFFVITSIQFLPMYNYQTHLKQQELSRKFSQIKKEYNRTTLHRQKSNPTLVHSHKKRIQGFVLSMIDKPIAVSQYTNHPHAFRDEDPLKNIAANAFYLKHQNQSQRIKESAKKNSELDIIPFSNTFSHKFRQNDKGSQSMKYKPVSHNFRIKQFLDQQTLNYLPNTSNQKLDKIIHRSQKKKNMDRQTLNKTINKSLLPFLHTKTYFKSVQTLFAELPKQWKGESAYEKKASTQEIYDESEIEIKRQAKKSNDHLSRKQNSRQALMKCNMLHSKQPSQNNSISHSRSGYLGSMRA